MIPIRKYLPVILLASCSTGFHAQDIRLLYPEKIPNSLPYEMKEVTVMNPDGTFKGYRKVSQPTLEVFLPDSSITTTKAVIICPGGGYISESYKGEGILIAEAFNRQGIAAFVLKYRLPSDSIMQDKSLGPLQDAQQAIKFVREHAEQWKIDPHKVGIMGFSAGGHLASTAGTHFNVSYIPNKENTSLRPDFLILAYPVISMTDSLAHMGSRNNLLGSQPAIEQIRFFSSEMQVTADTPPTWLMHAGDDTSVPVENSIRFYQALIRNTVPAEMHLYPRGNHAFILRMKPEDWMGPLFDWLKKLN